MPNKIMGRQPVEAQLAPYAVDSAVSCGRRYPEQPHAYRSPFQRDRDRIVHSSAFRRLAHKTQVFTGTMGDYHRSRLTHTLEVASIARTIGRELRLNEDLTEALALMHDIGHPPFGHAGEKVLDTCCQSCGGFNHNAHALRIVELLETRYPEFPGLNLCAETLSGQKARANKSGARPHTKIPLEVQLVDAADSIAYDTHDADDALEMQLLELDDLLEVSLWQEAAERVRQRFTALDSDDFRRAVIHQLIETLVSDVLVATRIRIAEQGIADSQDVLECEVTLVLPSKGMLERKSLLERFLFERVYRHPKVLQERAVAENALQNLFFRHVDNLDSIPEKFRRNLPDYGPQQVTCDYLASMTDRMALDLHRS